MEKFEMPPRVVGRVCDKSSWARLGLSVFNTVIEPGWRGFLTLELKNQHHDRYLEINEGDPIAQIVFEFTDEACESPYSGRYQDQASGPQSARLFEENGVDWFEVRSWVDTQAPAVSPTSTEYRQWIRRTEEIMRPTPGARQNLHPGGGDGVYDSNFYIATALTVGGVAAEEGVNARIQHAVDPSREVVEPGIEPPGDDVGERG
jgi:hypothetical protein